MKTQIDIILKQVTKGKIVFCAKNAPKQTKKPVTQAQMLDMIGFLKADYLTASFIKDILHSYIIEKSFDK